MRRVRRTLAQALLAMSLAVPPLTGIGAPARAAATDDYLIAFTAALSGPFNLGGIFVMRPDGSDVRQITSFDTPVFDYEAHGLNLPDDHPSFSPDGRTIAFTSSREGFDFEIYLMDVNGANVRRLTHNPGLDTEPVFSPDGSRILFASERDGRHMDIYVMDADGSNLQQLTDDPLEEDEPAWSPDGTKIAFTRIQGHGDKDVFVMEADGSNVRQLTFEPGEDHDATFSPDGTEVVITSEREGTRPFGDTFRVRVSDGAFLQNLTASLRQGGGDPAWSPDGSRVAFFKSPIPVLVSTQMWMVGADGSNPHKIANQGLVNVHPAWGKVADVDDDGTPDYQQGDSFPGTYDVSMQLTAAPEPVVTGSALTLTGTVRNFGPSEAFGAVALFPVPDGTSLAAATPSQGSCSTVAVNGVPTMKCELGDLAVGTATVVDMRVNVDCALVTGDVIQSTGLAAAVGVDARTANNSAEVVSTALDTPPRLTPLSASPTELWPPDHSMRDVTVDYAVTDNCDPDPALSFHVASNEPVNGAGDGDTAPDWEVVDAHHLQLRAERAGSGTGRIYTGTVTATDTHGNASRGTMTVTVPRNR